MSSVNYLTGGKGGGGGNRTVTRTPDNLRSKDTVEVILALGEGPIFGLVDGAKSFYVGDTPLQNANGDFNFQAFTLKFYPGSDVAEKVKPTLGGLTSNTSVNVTLGSDVPVVRTTSIAGGIDYLEVRIGFNRLYKTDDAGTYNHDAKFRIEYKASSSSTWIKYANKDLSYNGKTTSTYVKEFRWAVPNIAGSYDIRVTKLNPANTETAFSDFGWESFQEVISTEKAFNNTAIIQVCGESSDQFSNIPQWSGIYKGLLVKVPQNYDPVARTYTGIWDGTWKIAYTNNAALCLYDFVMNDRYGLRAYYLELDLDKYDVYDAAQWCDGMVPDGKGGLQPRYTFNTILTEATDGKEMARYIAGVFNATFFDDLNGKAFLRVDKDDPAAHIFMPENVTEDGFEYSYTDLSSRYNDITVTFINPELDWEQDRRRVFNQTQIDKNGRIPLDFIAVGCIDVQEALRRAHGKLITANTETCIVNFTTNRLGSYVNPFDVILICDPDMGYGISGRIKSLNNDRDVATLRDPIYLEVGVTYKATFTLNDGSKFTTTLQDVFPGYNTEMKFSGGLPTNLPERATFALEAEGVIGLPRPFRVIEVTENDGSVDSCTIQAININRNKWYDIDNLTDSGVIDYSALPNPLNPPGPISCTFEERFVKDKRRFEIIVNPIFNRGAYKYYANDHSFEVWSRLANTEDDFVLREMLYGDTLIDHPPGLYEFRILGKSYLGFKTDLGSTPPFQFNVTNPIEPPKPIDWIKINKREVYWGYENAPDDFSGFLLRYHNQAGRITWDDAAQPHQGVISQTSYYTQLIPPSARVIMVRPVDFFGVVSTTSAIIYRDLGDIAATNVIDQIDFHPDWDGILTGAIIEDGKIKALDTETMVYSGTPTAFMYDGGAFYEATYEEMTYESEFSVASAGEVVISIDFEGSGYEVLIRNVGDTAWSPIPELAEIAVGDYEILLRVFGGHVRGIVNSFSIQIQGTERIEDIQDVAIADTGTRIPLPSAFNTIRIVSVIIQDPTGTGTAVGYRVIDKDPTLGPLIKLVDASGAFVGGLVDATIKGF